MGKRERKIEVIQKYIKGVAKGWSAYTYGSIPDTLIRNACNNYAGAVQKESVLGLIDITVLGNGKKGMMFTESKIYYDNGIMESRGSVSYLQVYNEETIPGGLFSVSYNETALTELVSILADIEGETFEDKVNGTIDGIEQGVQSIVGVIERGAELFNMVSGLFGVGNSDDEE